MSAERIAEIREQEGGDRFGWAWLDELELPSKREGEATAAWTDRINASGAALGRNRQCSIGWHDECSDPEGAECKCPCHTHSRSLDTTHLTNALRWITRACADLLAELATTSVGEQSTKGTT